MPGRGRGPRGRHLAIHATPAPEKPLVSVQIGPQVQQLQQASIQQPQQATIQPTQVQLPIPPSLARADV